MKRGDLATVVVQGDFGKPRPALIIQADQYASHSSVTVLPLSSHVVDAPLMRITLLPDEVNGLNATSQIMIDKIMTIKRAKVRAVFGCIDSITMLEVERCLAVFLGVAK